MSAGDPPVTAYIAMGSNLGDRESHLAFARLALRAHPEIGVVCASDIIETPPLGPPGQGSYLNAVVAILTTLSPRALLDVLLDVERKRGRVRSSALRWGPRTLDLDLLLYGDRCIDDEGLTIPHPRMHERLFVLEPLAQIALSVVHPTRGETIETMAARLRATHVPEGIAS